MAMPPGQDEPVILDPCVLAEAPGLLGRLLDLNNAHAVELSYLGADRLAELIGRAFLALTLGEGGALLIAFDQTIDYKSPNFLWFRARFDRFVYVDRVVVSPAARGRGYGRRLYEALFRRAEAAGHDRIVCEINSDPPNTTSDVFHEGLGFGEVGAGVIDAGAEAVRYMSRRLV
jgi:predicted GNAT superfamily acetyltransferase